MSPPFMSSGLPLDKKSYHTTNPAINRKPRPGDSSVSRWPGSGRGCESFTLWARHAEVRQQDGQVVQVDRTAGVEIDVRVVRGIADRRAECGEQQGQIVETN